MSDCKSIPFEDHKELLDIAEARIAELEAQLAEARAQVHLAFYEGFESRRIDVDLAWDKSRAKEALAGGNDNNG